MFACSSCYKVFWGHSFCFTVCFILNKKHFKERKGGGKEMKKVNGDGKKKIKIKRSWYEHENQICMPVMQNKKVCGTATFFWGGVKDGGLLNSSYPRPSQDSSQKFGGKMILGFPSQRSTAWTWTHVGRKIWLTSATTPM